MSQLEDTTSGINHKTSRLLLTLCILVLGVVVGAAGAIVVVLMIVVGCGGLL